MRLVNNKWLFFIVSVLVLASCKGPGKLSYRNISGFYKPDRQLEGLSYALFNLGDTITNLYVRFPMEGLTYKTENGTGKSHFRLSYQLFDGYEKGALIDSATVFGSDSLRQKDIFLDSLPVLAPAGKDYVLSVELTDLNADISYGAFLNLQKKHAVNIHDYLLLDEYGRPLMRSWLFRNEPMYLRSVRESEVLTVSYFKRKYLPASPPHTLRSSSFGQTPDSTFEISVSNGFSGLKTFAGEGRYLIESKGRQVVVIHRFYDGFPKIGSVVQMRESVRYISTDAEYTEMEQQPPRAAIDQFWVKLTGHSERALSQLKRYYGRVEEANRFFTLSREGWKSDRGMIYIIFGPPNIVYRNGSSEQWTYGEPGNPLSLRFLFSYESIPENQADFLLIRSETYRNPWHMAVSNWRR